MHNLNCQAKVAFKLRLVWYEFGTMFKDGKDETNIVLLLGTGYRWSKVDSLSLFDPLSQLDSD